MLISLHLIHTQTTCNVYLQSHACIHDFIVTDLMNLDKFPSMTRRAYLLRESVLDCKVFRENS